MEQFVRGADYECGLWLLDGTPCEQAMMRGHGDLLYSWALRGEGRQSR
jgi:hypothetical protein